MIEHHIIYTIPVSITGRRGPLRYARHGKMTSYLNSKDRYSPVGVVR